MAYIGSQQVSKFYIGSNPLYKLYRGSTLLWEKSDIDTENIVLRYNLDTSASTFNVFNAGKYYFGGVFDETIQIDINTGNVYNVSAGNHIARVKALGTLPEYGFRNSQQPVSVQLPPNKIQVINNEGIRFSKITTLEIPDSVSEIKYYGVVYNTSLQTLVIGTGLTKLGTYSVSNNMSLQSITIKATTPPTLENKNAFVYTNNCPIYVPSGSLSTYRNATNWSAIADRIQAIPV